MHGIPTAAMSQKSRRRNPRQQDDSDASSAFDTPLVATLHVPSAQAPDFWQGCPTSPASGPEEAAACPVVVQELQGLQAWLTWLCKAVSEDPGTHLSFSPSLSKEQRARIHKCVEADFARHLMTVSSGVGDQRAISVYGRGTAACNTRDAITSQVRERASMLHKFLGIRRGSQGGVTQGSDAGHTSWSLDELTEALATGKLPGDVQGLLDQLESSQPAVARILEAISQSTPEECRDLLLEHADVLRQGTPHLATGDLPLQAAARQAQLSWLRALAAAGAPLDALDMRGQTALQVAQAAEETDAEAVLLQLGAHNPDAEAFPLSLAAADLGH